MIPWKRVMSSVYTEGPALMGNRCEGGDRAREREGASWGRDAPPICGVGGLKKGRQIST